jgi:hypothetical protein
MRRLTEDSAALVPLQCYIQKRDRAADFESSSGWHHRRHSITNACIGWAAAAPLAPRPRQPHATAFSGTIRSPSHQRTALRPK